MKELKLARGVQCHRDILRSTEGLSELFAGVLGDGNTYLPAPVLHCFSVALVQSPCTSRPHLHRGPAALAAPSGGWYWGLCLRRSSLCKVGRCRVKLCWSRGGQVAYIQ